MIKTEKSNLRKQLREDTKKLSSLYKKEASDVIADVFLDLPEYKRCNSIFVYISSPDEPDTSKIIKKALSDNKEVFVPKCIGKGEMLAIRISDTTVFSKGYMGITEPIEYTKEDILTVPTDITVVPCMSVTDSGKRLGHGAGFYDMYLSKYASKTVCLCFEKLKSKFIPTDANDVIMDAVISEKGYTDVCYIGNECSLKEPLTENYF